ncbi:MAG TPA: hypothetical protein VIQ31_26565, partial [Phormidium sp.]
TFVERIKHLQRSMNNTYISTTDLSASHHEPINLVNYIIPRKTNFINDNDTNNYTTDVESNDESLDDDNVLLGQIAKKLAIKTNSYNMFVTREESKLQNLNARSSKSIPSHNAVMNLFMQVLEHQAAAQFMMQFKIICALCKREALAVAAYPDLELDEALKYFPLKKDAYAFPHTAPPFVPSHISATFKGLFIGKTPAWVIGFALLRITGQMVYALHRTDVSELSHAADHAYIIQGENNYLCRPHKSSSPMKHHPADPIVNFSHANNGNKNRSAKKQKKSNSNSAVLFVPSTGIYYSTLFTKATPRINAWGTVMSNKIAREQRSLLQLPATAL